MFIESDPIEDVVPPGYLYYVIENVQKNSVKKMEKYKKTQPNATPRQRDTKDYIDNDKWILNIDLIPPDLFQYDLFNHTQAQPKTAH